MKKILILFLVLVITSCEKILFKKDLGSIDPLENFDYLWNEIDKKYSYFELKNIDWEQSRIKYRAMLTEDSKETKLFSVLATMLNELRDDHTNLISPFNVSQYNVALTGPANFNQRTLDENYTVNAWKTGPFIHSYLHDEKIGYVRYSSFSSNYSEAHMDLIIDKYSHTKGIILDLRENGGGSIFNVPKLLGRFTNVTTLVGYTITRNGPNHSDFTEKESFYITPASNYYYTGPVIVLIDRGSFSATTFFAMATKALPNIKLMGDTTGGGGGLPNGGQLPNGWTYRFSISQLLDLNGNNYAESGVPPDIQASFDWSDLSKDEILDKAIEELMN